jgi:uncharacterized protein YbbC (DUF1343 family)
MSASIKFGIDRLIADAVLQSALHGKRVALLGHAASVTGDGRHAMEALFQAGISLQAAFGPQHGIRGDVQDNMIETGDEQDAAYGIPVFSLYGTVRRPSAHMMDCFDVILVDLQDIGTRIYTFVTTLGYLLEACAATGKSVWVLDRPNPAGRPIEGFRLRPGWESFVGLAPLLMRHGLTLGEIGQWYVDFKQLDVDYRIIGMEGYDWEAAPGFGWPVGQRAWVNPSPNASSLNMARCFPGTVLLEGTTLSEGRGTSTPLEVVGAPDLDRDRILSVMQTLAPEWMEGCWIRPCFFEPTFHKHMGQLCYGMHIHTDHASYQHDVFQPFRLIALWLKALRQVHPDYTIWRQFEYEYETERLAIDLLCGGPMLREWVDDSQAHPADLEQMLLTDEDAWRQERSAYLIY